MAHSWPYPLATVLILLLLWDLTVRLFGLPVYLIPRPSAVASRIVSDAGLLLRHGGVTLAESVGGFLLSVAIGVPPGMALVASRLLERAVMPLLVVSQSFPKVAIAPLIVIWFGLGVLPKLVIGFLTAFFPVVISAIAGMRSVDPDLLDLARSMQGNGLRTFLRAGGARECVSIPDSGAEARLHQLGLLPCRPSTTPPAASTSSTSAATASPGGSCPTAASVGSCSRRRSRPSTGGSTRPSARVLSVMR